MVGGGETPAIRIEGLTKRFGNRAAVDDLTLEVRRGEVFGFLGPNGAGKTTTIRLLLGLMRPDAGTSCVLGAQVPAPATLPNIGAMIEEPAFYPWLSGAANLRVLAETGPRIAAGAVDEALAMTGLADVAGRKVRGYSQGMRQRLGLAAALMRRPGLLILDEPANGLDPAGIREFRDRFRSLGDAGVTVFISSHLLGEVARICDRVGIVDRGRLVAVGTVDELSRRGGAAGTTQVRVTVRPEDLEPAVRLLERFAVRPDGPGSLMVKAASGRDVNEALARGGIFAEGIAADGAGLEEAFLALTHAPEEGAKPDAAARG